MNSTLEGNGIHSEAEAARLVQQIRFSGQSKACGKPFLLRDLLAQLIGSVSNDPELSLRGLHIAHLYYFST